MEGKNETSIKSFPFKLKESKLATRGFVVGVGIISTSISCLYQGENYKLRYREIYTASIELIIASGEKIGFNYKIEIDNYNDIYM